MERSSRNGRRKASLRSEAATADACLMQRACAVLHQTGTAVTVAVDKLRKAYVGM